MATLEKIRSRSALLFGIIILALLAFIMGDFLTSSRSFFSDPTTLAKVDGHKININEFSSRVEQIRAQRQEQGYSDIDIAPIQQQVLNQMVYEALMNEELDKLGITVTDAELTAALTGENALPAVVAQVRQMGLESPEMFYDMAYNPAKYNVDPAQAQQLKEMWENLEKNTTEQLRQQKFGQLFMGLLTANNVDAKALYDDNARTANVLITRQDLNSLPNDEFKVSDADIKAQYDKHKSLFRLKEPVREVDYIVVNVEPSAEDIAAAQTEVSEAVEALKAQPGTEGVNGNVNFGVKRQNLPKARINNAPVKATLDSMSVGDVNIASMANNVYTIVKLFGVKADVDSVQYDFAIVEGSKETADSVVNLLNNGAKASDLMEAGTVSQAQDSLWLTLLSDNPGVAQMRDQILAAQTGTYFSLDTVPGQNYYRLLRVVNRKAPVQAYDFAEITYTTEPSTKTLHTLEGQLSRFIGENNTAALLAENAEAANYHVFPAELTTSSLELNNVPDTREGVNWAMNAKKGQVSPIFKNDQNSRMVVVALKEVYDGKYIPMTDENVNRYLTEEAIKALKADKLIKEYQGKGKTVSDYANLMKTQVDTAQINFGQPRIAGFFTPEPALSGRVAAAKVGELNGPFQGTGSVIVFEVLSVDEQDMPYDYASSAAMFNRSAGVEALSRNFNQILTGNKKVENRIQKFYTK